MSENICHAAVKQIEKQPVRPSAHTLQIWHICSVQARKALKTNWKCIRAWKMENVLSKRKWILQIRNSNVKRQHSRMHKLKTHVETDRRKAGAKKKWSKEFSFGELSSRICFLYAKQVLTFRFCSKPWFAQKMRLKFAEIYKTRS